MVLCLRLDDSIACTHIPRRDVRSWMSFSLDFSNNDMPGGQTKKVENVFASPVMAGLHGRSSSQNSHGKSSRKIFVAGT